MSKECRHIMPNGSKCHSPALRDRSYCFFHQKLHASLNASKEKKDRLELASSLEDAKGIQIALTQVLDALTKSSIDPRRAGLLIYGLQLATQLTRKSADFDPSKTVSNVCHDEDGSLMALDEIICESPLECPTCPQQDACPTDRKQSKVIRN
jgi:hypothetical protein